MVSRTLYFDIDSTLWPAETEYMANAIELFGKELDTTYQYNDKWLEENYGPNYVDMFYLDPANIAQREVYPGVVEGIQYAYKKLGFNIHFLSHNSTPADMFEPVDKWLWDNLRIDFDLTIFEASNCKVAYMQDDPTAWGIVEDKPKTIFDAYDAGYVVFGKRQPWNLQIVDGGGIIFFNEWTEFPQLLYKRLMFGDVVLAYA